MNLSAKGMAPGQGGWGTPHLAREAWLLVYVIDGVPMEGSPPPPCMCMYMYTDVEAKGQPWVSSLERSSVGFETGSLLGSLA